MDHTYRIGKIEIGREIGGQLQRRMKQGSFDIHLEHRRLEATVNRLVLGIITAALFVGSATLWSREVPPILGGYSLPGVLGCVGAVFLGWRVTRAIKRSGDMG